MNSEGTYTTFVGEKRIAAGILPEILPELKRQFDEDQSTMFLTFEDESGKQLDFNLRGTIGEVMARVATTPQRTGPGRPRLGVTAREITLLPRHWEWLEEQPRGASAAIRRLIDEARKSEPDTSRKQRAAFAAGRFLSAMAGNYPGYEEATRALYAGDAAQFANLIGSWPTDVREYALRLWERA